MTLSFARSLLAGTIILSTTHSFAIDSDFDGVSYERELALGLDDSNRDVDNDGLIDGLEHGGNAILSIDPLAPLNTNGKANHPHLTSDGEKVVYTSNKTHMVTGAHDGDNIFITDIPSGNTQLVSTNSDGIACTGNSWDPEISGDGRYVAFSGFCQNLVSQTITGNWVQVYLKDLQTGQVELVSRNIYGESGKNHSQFPTISKDGRYVVFSSYAADMVEGIIGNDYSDIYLFDRETLQTTLISKSITGGLSNNRAYHSKLSKDGRFITFGSAASNLVENDTNGKRDIFVYEIATQTIDRVSVSSENVQGTGASTYPSLSADGKYVLFTSWSNLHPADWNNKLDAYLHNRETKTTKIMSLDSLGNTADRHSIAGAVSDNGRYVAFRSQARAMTDDQLYPSNYPDSVSSLPTNVEFFAYVKDRKENTTALFTKPFDANAPDGFVEHISIADNGVVAFHARGSRDSWIEDESSMGNDVYATKTTFIDNKGPELQFGTIAAVDNTQWIVVDLPKHYNAPVIVTTPIYDNNSAPLVTRIKNIESNRFEIKIQRADNSTAPIAAIKVNYMVAEAGVYTEEEHGIKMEAVQNTSTNVDGKSTGWNGSEQAYLNTYTAPVVVGQVMSYNDEGFSTFWSRGSSVGSIANQVLKVGKHIAEDTNTTREDETVGYIVIETGSLSLGGDNLQSLVSNDSIRGMTNGSYSVNLINASTSSIIISSSAGMDGNNGGWPVVLPNSTSETQVLVTIDEDQIKDSERKHTTEQVSVIAFTPN